MSTTREKDIAAYQLQGQARVTHAAVWADACAHRDKQVIAFLRERWAGSVSRDRQDEVERYLDDMADAIERGEHVR